jgi:hypothetical protein
MQDQLLGIKIVFQGNVEKLIYLTEENYEKFMEGLRNSFKDYLYEMNKGLTINPQNVCYVELIEKINPLNSNFGDIIKAEI